jgi:hypothetical protein
MPEATPGAPGAPGAPAQMEELPGFLRFTPVAVKPRHDGWSAELQLRFVLALARGAGVDEAARRLGRSRTSAYALRRRPGGKSFGAAWDAAAAFAEEMRGMAAARPPGSGAPIETLLAPRARRGRSIGVIRREDLSGALARLRRLDRLAERLGAQDLAALRAATEELDRFLGRR